MKLNYCEGTLFLVRLQNGGFARGVVGRVAPRGRILLGFFFAPKILDAEGVNFEQLRANEAILVARCSDLGLREGHWPVKGKLSEWDRFQWSVPTFVRRDDISEKAWEVRYSDADPSHVESERPVEFNSLLRRDALFGYSALEHELSSLLGSNVTPPRSDKSKNGLDAQMPRDVEADKLPQIEHYLYFNDVSNAHRVAEILRSWGYRATVDLGADGVNWLVLADSDEPPANVESQAERLTPLAVEYGGEYDGWEVDATGA